MITALQEAFKINGDLSTVLKDQKLKSTIRMIEKLKSTIRMMHMPHPPNLTRDFSEHFQNFLGFLSTRHKVRRLYLCDMAPKLAERSRDYQHLIQKKGKERKKRKEKAGLDHF